MSFLWNPAFDSPGDVTGLTNFRLVFVASDEAGQSSRRPPAFVLEASPRERRPAQVENPVSALPNGFFLVLFRPDLRFVRPGTYELLSAEAEAALAPEFPGPAPRMNHSPLRQHFCLEVTARGNR